MAWAKLCLTNMTADVWSMYILGGYLNGRQRVKRNVWKRIDIKFFGYLTGIKSF